MATLVRTRCVICGQLGTIDADRCTTKQSYRKALKGQADCICLGCIVAHERPWTPEEIAAAKDDLLRSVEEQQKQEKRRHAEAQ